MGKFIARGLVEARAESTVDDVDAVKQFKRLHGRWPQEVYQDLGQRAGRTRQCLGGCAWCGEPVFDDENPKLIELRAFHGTCYAEASKAFAEASQ